MYFHYFRQKQWKRILHLREGEQAKTWPLSATNYWGVSTANQYNAWWKGTLAPCWYMRIPFPGTYTVLLQVVVVLPSSDAVVLSLLSKQITLNVCSIILPVAAYIHYRSRNSGDDTLSCGEWGMSCFRWRSSYPSIRPWHCICSWNEFSLLPVSEFISITFFLVGLSSTHFFLLHTFFTCFSVKYCHKDLLYLVL